MDEAPLGSGPVTGVSVMKGEASTSLSLCSQPQRGRGVLRVCAAQKRTGRQRPQRRRHSRKWSGGWALKWRSRAVLGHLSLPPLSSSLHHSKPVWANMAFRRSHYPAHYTHTHTHMYTTIHKMTRLIIGSLAALTFWFTADFIAVNFEESCLTFIRKTFQPSDFQVHIHAQRLNTQTRMNKLKWPRIYTCYHTSAVKVTRNCNSPSHAHTHMKMHIKTHTPYTDANTYIQTHTNTHSK